MGRKIGHALIATANLIRRTNLDDNCSGKVEITPMQGFFMGQIYLNSMCGKETYQKDLEAEFSLRRSTASGILANMEENGLIKREVSKKDARLKTLTLTEKSLDMCKKRRKTIEKTEERLANGLTPEEIETFFDIISKIRKNIDENDDWGNKFQ